MGLQRKQEGIRRFDRSEECSLRRREIPRGGECWHYVLEGFRRLSKGEILFALFVRFVPREFLSDGAATREQKRLGMEILCTVV